MGLTFVPFFYLQDAIRLRETQIEEMSEAEMKRYSNYVSSDLNMANHAKFTKKQLDKIKVGMHIQGETGGHEKVFVERL